MATNYGFDFKIIDKIIKKKHYKSDLSHACPIIKDTKA